MTSPEAEASPPLALRIAVHLGDVITTEEDIYGDNVNVAARLQEFSEPRGIVLSETVYDLVRGSSGSHACDLGFLELKNIAKPIRAYALASEFQGIQTPLRPSRALLPSIAILPLLNASGIT